jgi:hypothetical protein
LEAHEVGLLLVGGGTQHQQRLERALRRLVGPVRLFGSLILTEPDGGLLEGPEYRRLRERGREVTSRAFDVGADGPALPVPSSSRVSIRTLPSDPHRLAEHLPTEPVEESRPFTS